MKNRLYNAITSASFINLVPTYLPVMLVSLPVVLGALASWSWTTIFLGSALSYLGFNYINKQLLEQPAINEERLDQILASDDVDQLQQIVRGRNPLSLDGELLLGKVLQSNRDSLECIKFLLKRTDLTTIDHKGRSFLHYLPSTFPIQHDNTAGDLFRKEFYPMLKQMINDPKVTKKLINHKDKQGNTALHCLMDQNDDIELMALLKAKGADLDAQNDVGNTPLHLTVLKSSNTNARTLIKLGARNDIKNNYGTTAPELTVNIADRQDNKRWLDTFSELGVHKDSFDIAKLRTTKQHIAFEQGYIRSQARITTSISCEQFDQEVNNFINRHKLANVADMYDPNRGAAQEVLQALFFSNPVISGYLERENIEFNDTNPKIDSVHEQLLYQAKKKVEQLDKKKRVPYRSEEHRGMAPMHCDTPHRQTFYSIGASPYTSSIIAAEYAPLLTGTKNIAVITKVKDHDQLDCYKIDSLISDTKEVQAKITKGKNTGYSFALFPMGKDGHATTVIAIIDNKTHKPKHIIFINSTEGQIYYDMIKERIHQNKKLEDQYPIIDASVVVQTADDDMNCALYSNNITKALIRIISENQDQLAKLTDSGNHQDMISFFQANLKAALPIYFNPDGTAKSHEELRNYHLRRRWEIGNVAIREWAREAIEFIARITGIEARAAQPAAESVEKKTQPQSFTARLELPKGNPLALAEID